MSSSPHESLPFQLNQVSLDISQLAEECFVWWIEPAQVMAGLIRFSGLYRRGSDGSDDALFIRWRINEFCELSLPGRIYGLVVDFTNLDYEWGDDLSVEADRLGRISAPLLVVVSPDRFEAFQGVLGSQELRTDLAQALQEVTEVLSSASQAESDS